MKTVKGQVQHKRRHRHLRGPGTQCGRGKPMLSTGACGLCLGAATSLSTKMGTRGNGGPNVARPSKFSGEATSPGFNAKSPDFSMLKENQDFDNVGSFQTWSPPGPVQLFTTSPGLENTIPGNPSLASLLCWFNIT